MLEKEESPARGTLLAKLVLGINFDIPFSTSKEMDHLVFSVWNFTHGNHFRDKL